MFRMSGSSLSFYPTEEGDSVGQYEIKTREPGQLEILFRTCRLASSEGLSELRLATDSARTVARGETSPQRSFSDSQHLDARDLPGAVGRGERVGEGGSGGRPG